MVILRFDDISHFEEDERGTVIFETDIALRELIQALAQGAKDVLNERGSETYLEQWGRHDFPAEQLSTLQDWLAGLVPSFEPLPAKRTDVS